MDFNVIIALLPPITAVALFFYISYKRNQFQDDLPNVPNKASPRSSGPTEQDSERDWFYDYYRWLSASFIPSAARIFLIGFSESLYNILYYKWQKRGKAEDRINALVAQHVERRQAKGRPFAIVTGGNAGLGYEIARVLLLADYHVILACRSKNLAQSAVTRLQATTGSDKVEYMHLDLAMFTSVRAFADSVAERLKAGEKIDVLIHNAGIMNIPFALTVDGFETQLQVNVLAPHLLTHCLLPQLSGSARIVFTTSSAMYGINHIDLSLFTDRARYSGLGNYAASKICATVLAREWDRKLSKGGRVVNAYHPGAVHTNIFTSTPLLNLSLFSPLLDLVLLSPSEGAMTALKLALDEPAAERQGGKYWFDELPRRFQAISIGVGVKAEEKKQDVVGGWLWKEAGRMCGITEGKGDNK